MATARPRLDRRTTTLVIAAVLAMGTGLLTFQYLSSVGRHQTVALAPRSIVIAVRDIPARVQIAPEMLTTVMRPADAIDPDTITDVSAAIGRIAAVSVPAGGAITASKIATFATATLGTRIPRGMRAVSIPLDRVKAVGNLIQPGDRVDIIAVTPARAGQQPQAATILRDVTVLAMGTTLESIAGATPSPDSGFATISLALSPDQAQLLTLVDLNATLRLTLRGTGDASGRPLTGEKIDLSTSAVVMPMPRANAIAPVAAAAPAAPQAAAPAMRQGPLIINGDQVLK